MVVPSLVPPVVPAGTMAGGDQPSLTGLGLVLRPWRSADAGALVRAYADPDIQRWHARSLTMVEADTWIGMTHRQWRAESGASWAVTVEDDAEPAARMALRRIDLTDGLGEVAYWTMPDRRGRGIASRALRLVTGWSIDELGLHRLEIEHAVGNAASCRTAGRAGYPLEGVKRSQTRLPDGWHDVHLHVLLGPEPPDHP